MNGENEMNETQECLMCDEILVEMGEVWLEKISEVRFLRTSERWSRVQCGQG
jgi:hypothetical protein